MSSDSGWIVTEDTSDSAFGQLSQALNQGLDYQMTLQDKQNIDELAFRLEGVKSLGGEFAMIEFSPDVKALQYRQRIGAALKSRSNTLVS